MRKLLALFFIFPVFGVSQKLYNHSFSGEKISHNYLTLSYLENHEHPEWMWCTKGQHNFTLFFKALPKNCKAFDLFEDIPELGGFVKKNIRRNKSDVYHVE